MKAFAFARMIRDAWLTWPARIGPQLAATFDLDAATVTVTLEQYVRQRLEDLASERVEFQSAVGARRPPAREDNSRAA